MRVHEASRCTGSVSFQRTVPTVTAFTGENNPRLAVQDAERKENNERSGLSSNLLGNQNSDQKVESWVIILLGHGPFLIEMFAINIEAHHTFLGQQLLTPFQQEI